MRVIAGSARGVRLGSVPAGTRPLSDRAREGLFSSLGQGVVDARCADLFAGTGAMGIEALSRGAGSCLFVDQAAVAIRAVRENLSRTGLGDRATVVRAPVRTALERAPGIFDLSFLDPPYASGREALADTIARLVRLMAPGSTIALTRPKKGSTNVIPIHWSVVKLLTYGDTQILICREAA
jgi:16S rRNA (guanine966-N2)-methyltransferase